MAEGSHETADINEMFQKMAQKLGWYQDKQGIHSDQLHGDRKKRVTKPKAEGTGSEKKRKKRKEQPAKTTKVREKADTGSTESSKASETTPAHAKVLEPMGSAGFSSSGKNKVISVGQKNPEKSGNHRSKLDFDFSSSDDEDFQPIPLKRTPAHTNLLIKDLKSTSTCKNHNNNQKPDSNGHQVDLSKSGKKVLHVFDLSSSDSELEPVSSFLKPDAKNTKPAGSKPGRAKVSDSFVAQVDEAEDTFVSCVGESFMDQHAVPKIGHVDEELKKSTLSQKDMFSADDTIVQKPVCISSESFSPDMDITFSQPPCESTRIHRRSSVSYKKLLGSPEDLSSETSDENKHYETCRPNVSGEEDNNESEDPFSVTTYEAQGNEKRNMKGPHKPTKTVKCTDEVNGDLDNSIDNQNEVLCKELHNLSLHQHQSPASDSQKISDNCGRENAGELKRASSELSFDESFEVIDACTQTEQSISEDKTSPFKLSLNESDISETSRKLVRKKSSSSVQNVTDDESDSDASEVEIKDISIQTDIRSDTSISEIDANTNTSLKGNVQVNNDAKVSGQKRQVTAVVSDSDKEESLSEYESNSGNSEHGSDADNENADSSVTGTDDRRNSDSGENVSNLSNTDESNRQSGGLSSESGEIPKSKDDKKKNLKLKKKDTQNDKTNTERTGTCGVDDVSGHSEKDRGHLPDSPPAAEVKGTDQNTWRKKVKVSESSSEDDLEAYFEKLRNPKKATSAVRSSSSSLSSEASPVSMKDFIVDDDEMTSESDDNAFYIEENRKLDESPHNDRPKTLRPTTFPDFSDSDESDFTADRYPGSVTKHKKRATKPKTRSKSWSLSDENSDTYLSPKPVKIKSMHPEGVRDRDNKRAPKSDKKYKTKNHDEKVYKDQENNNKGVSDLSNAADDELLFKTPKPLTRVVKKSSNKENVPNEIFKTPKSSHDTAEVFRTPKVDPDREGIFKTPKSTHKLKTGGKESKKSEKSKTDKVEFITLSDSDDISSGELPDITPTVLKEVTTNTKLKSRSLTDEDLLRTPSSVMTKSKMNFYTPQPVQLKYSFLKSLSNVVQEHRRDPEAARFVSGFKKLKEELTAYLFRLYNRTVFDNQLPSVLPIEWNKRLLRTAGFCKYKKSSKNPDARSAMIELSTKVCDSAERVRDTLIHELCHAAVWLINGTKEGHGRYWKYWARKANHAHPEIPVIARCHDYSINTKYTYKCIQCGYSIGRHSKSLDTEKKVCGYCHGRFELQQNPSSLSSSRAEPMTPKTPRTPNRFALYVKEHYSAVKKDKNLKHGDVMKELSKQFAEMNRI